MPRNVRELRELGESELLERLESHKEELFNLRFQLATGQLDNPMRIKQVRHDVARILSVLGERDVDLQIEEEIARIDREALAQAREGKAPDTGRRLGLRRFRTKAEKTQRESLDDEGALPADEAEEADETGELDEVAEVDEAVEAEEAEEER